MATLSFDEMANALQRDFNMSRARAEAIARSQLGIRAPSVAELKDEVEDVHVDEGDKLMLALGFEIVKLSQKRRSKVTDGIPDRKYYHRRRRLTLWWEGKAEWGKQRPGQREFQEMAVACGEIYVLGKLEALKEWIVASGVATRDGDVFHPTPIAYTAA